MTTEWTRLQFSKFLGYPLVALCPACGKSGDHRMNGGGFHCQIDHTKNPNPIPNGWHVMTKLMHPLIYVAERWEEGEPVEFSKNFKTKEEAEAYIKEHESAK